MNALEAEGLARLAGPLEGTTEVLLVFRADSDNEIDERLPRRTRGPGLVSSRPRGLQFGTYGSARWGRKFA